MSDRVAGFSSTACATTTTSRFGAQTIKAEHAHRSGTKILFLEMHAHTPAALTATPSPPQEAAASPPPRTGRIAARLPRPGPSG
jgi:hypothetical protein